MCSRFRLLTPALTVHIWHDWPFTGVKVKGWRDAFMFKELGIIPKIPLVCIQNSKRRGRDWKTHLFPCLQILSVSCSAVHESSGIEATENLFSQSSICEIMPRRIKEKEWSSGLPVQTGNQSSAVVSVKVYRYLTGLYERYQLLYTILASWRSFSVGHSLSSHPWPFVIVTLWSRMKCESLEAGSLGCLMQAGSLKAKKVNKNSFLF